MSDRGAMTLTRLLGSSRLLRALVMEAPRSRKAVIAVNAMRRDRLALEQGFHRDLAALFHELGAHVEDRALPVLESHATLSEAVTPSGIKWKRVAAGDYVSPDGKWRLWKLPVSPPAWNVETNVGVFPEQTLVDGAASYAEAKELGDAAIARLLPPMAGGSVEADLVDQILASSHLREWAGSRLPPSFAKWWGLTRGQMDKSLKKAGLEVNTTGAAATRVLELGGRRAGLVDITGDTRAALFRAIEQGRAMGLNPRQTARLFRDIVPEGRFTNAGASYRAQLIARTETLHAQRVSSMEAYRSMKGVQHVIAFDGDEDEECAARDGQIFTLDDAEVEMETEHPNGTLAFGPVAT